MRKPPTLQMPVFWRPRNEFLGSPEIEEDDVLELALGRIAMLARAISVKNGNGRRLTLKTYFFNTRFTLFSRLNVLTYVSFS